MSDYAMTMPVRDDNRHVTMSNRLVRSAQSLNLAEKRMVALGLAATDSAPMSKLVAASNAGWKTRITALEYAATFDVDPTTAYEQMQAGAERLFERHVRYETKGPRGKVIEHKFRWVSGATYAPGDGCVELNFSPEIAPHLLGLRKQFTTYKLRHAARLSSVYAWRMFELVMSWRSTGTYSPTIEEFWDVIEAPPSCRKDFKSLRVRIIEPSVQEIRQKAGWLIEWEPVRAGSRRVSGLVFRFSRDPQGAFAFDDAPADAEGDEAVDLPFGHVADVSD